MNSTQLAAAELVFRRHFPSGDGPPPPGYRFPVPGIYFDELNNTAYLNFGGTLTPMGSSFPDGTATVPGIGFASAPTGLSRVGGDLSFVVAGDSKWGILSSGDLVPIAAASRLWSPPGTVADPGLKFRVADVMGLCVDTVPGAVTYAAYGYRAVRFEALNSVNGAYLVLRGNTGTPVITVDGPLPDNDMNISAKGTGMILVQSIVKMFDRLRLVSNLTAYWNGNPGQPGDIAWAMDANGGAGCPIAYFGAPVSAWRTFAGAPIPP